MHKGLVFILLLFFGLNVQAQEYNTPDIGKSSGKIQLENHVIHFDYESQHLAYICVTEKKATQKKLVEAWFKNGLLFSAKTFYTNGKTRSFLQMDVDYAYQNLSDYKNLPVYREPLLNLPFRYYLNGTCKRWSPDGTTCTITRYKNNQWVTDSLKTGDHIYALADLNARTRDFSIQEWLYDPPVLEELLQQAEKIKLPAEPVNEKLRFNPNDYIKNGLFFVRSKTSQPANTKTITRLLQKYYRKGELLSFTVFYTELKITLVEVNSETVTTQDKKKLVTELSKLLGTTGVRVNNMIANSGEISFYFHMGC